MNVALIAEPDWLAHETALFRRLIVGLADESVRAIPVVPERALEAELSLAADRVDYEPSRWPMVNGLRLRRLAGVLRKLEPDVLHVMSGRMAPWLAPLRLALGVPMVVSCWSVAQARRTARRSGPSVVLLPTTGLAEAAGVSVDSEAAGAPAARVIRPGVARPAETPGQPLADPEGAVCCLVICEGQPEAAATAMLEGLAEARRRLPQIQLFVYSLRGDEHRLWRHARRLDLLDAFNLVAAEPGSRRLLLNVDAVVRPEPLTTVRTLTLQAMAAGRPIIAAAGGVEDYLIADRTAELVEDPTPTDWAERFEALVRDPQRYRALGEGGREYVREHHGLAAHVASMIDLYRRVTGEPMSFEEAAAG